MRYSLKKVLTIIMILGMLAGLMPSFGSYKAMAAKSGSQDEDDILLDSEEQFKQMYPKLQTLVDNGTIGLKFEKRFVKETITLGRYQLFEQMYGNYPRDEADDLEWEILEYSEDGKSAFVISKYILVRYQYNDGSGDETRWEKAKVRKWLNNDFINSAFTDSERALIKTTTVKTPDYESIYYDEPLKGGKDTEDKLFLLSREEVDKYFLPEDRDPDVDYDEISLTSRIGRYISGKTGEWILRSPGDIEGYIAAVTSDGEVDDERNYVYDGIRPAFWIELTPELIENFNLSVGSSGKEITDAYVTFGNYDIPDERGNSDGNKDKLEWLICDYDEKENRALLLSRYLTRSMKYRYGEDDNNWEASDVRSWLNGDFYKEAFSSDEAVRIKNITINDKDISNVKNKIFILSLDEVEKYLSDYNLRIALYSDGQPGSWWLRTPGGNYHSLVGILADEPSYYCECFSEMSVRPAIYIDLDPNLSADEMVPETPEISAEPASDETGIDVYVDKTYDAEGYEIFIQKSGSSDYENAAVINKDGTKKRSTIVRNLAPGEYDVKVRAYRINENKTIYSSFSNEVKVNIGGYRDAEYLKEKYPKLQTLADKGLVSFNSEYERDTIKLGTWDNKTIEWEVLEYSADGKSALVMSKNILCNKYYNDKDESVTWKESSLRKWLNDEFINSAFSKSEKKLIKKTKIKNEDNKYFGTDGGKSTKDKVFLLSASEYEKYLEDNKKNKYLDRSLGFYTNGNSGSYWLRTPGEMGYSNVDYDDWDEEDWEDYEEEDYLAGYAAYVYDDGELEWEGNGVAYDALGVRPLMWIKLTDKIIEKNELSVKDNRKISEIYVVFGAIENESGSDPLEWQVLEYDEKNNKALLLSRYLVTEKPYMYVGNYHSEDGITWAESTIRTYLNDEFYNSAFTKEEQSLIKKVKIKNKDNKKTKTKGGKNTSDRIFLLSLSEVEKYFEAKSLESDSDSRLCRFKNGEVNEWWLRSPGISQDSVSYVYEDGSVRGNYYKGNNAGVRPAMWIELQ
ncbi:MAG: DUF6273 domain-containing protein [Lachnospiraceae bacterium]|nr:DUF6273 domain-containing protein [Lachnospiraceae bacterium]